MIKEFKHNHDQPSQVTGIKKGQLYIGKHIYLKS